VERGVTDRCGPGAIADAISELRDLRSSDPAARAAVQAIKLTQFTLETVWSQPDPPDLPA